MATFPEYMRRPPVIVRVRVTRSVVVLCVVFWILCCLSVFLILMTIRSVVKISNFVITAIYHTKGKQSYIILKHMIDFIHLQTVFRCQHGLCRLVHRGCKGCVRTLLWKPLGTIKVGFYLKHLLIKLKFLITSDQTLLK
jgi:hypothetical protein